MNIINDITDNASLPKKDRQKYPLMLNMEQEINKWKISFWNNQQQAGKFSLKKRGKKVQKVQKIS